MKVLRTPESRFEGLEGYPFAPNYIDFGDGLRMHYVDEGLANGPTVLLLHGEPTWSYLYRKMIPPLAAAGFRAIAPDLIGFGKSDKPSKIKDYSYALHERWLLACLDVLELDEITLFAQDWGSPLGLRIAGLQPDRFATTRPSLRTERPGRVSGGSRSRSCVSLDATIRSSASWTGS